MEQGPHTLTDHCAPVLKKTREIQGTASGTPTHQQSISYGVEIKRDFKSWFCTYNGAATVRENRQEWFARHPSFKNPNSQHNTTKSFPTCLELH